MDEPEEVYQVVEREGFGIQQAFKEKADADAYADRLNKSKSKYFYDVVKITVWDSLEHRDNYNG